MRVLLFRNLYDVSGISRWMQEHGRELCRQGVEVEYWFCTPHPGIAEFEAIAPTTVGPMVDLVRRLEAHPFDVIHISSVDAAAEALTLVEPWPRIVATNHGGLAEFWNSHNCHACTAVSPDFVRFQQSCTDLQVELVENGVDAARFFPPTTPDTGLPIVAFAGRTTDVRRKDFPRVTRILSKLDPATVRVWVADGRDGGWDRLPPDRTVRIPVERWSPLSHEEMPDFYRAVAASGGVVLMASPAEACSLVNLEASACGATVVAPDVIGLRHTVLDKDALYPYDASDDDVAALLRTWLARNRSNLDAVRTRARLAFERFSIRTQVQSYLEIYQRPHQLLAPQPLPPLQWQDRHASVVMDTFHNFGVIRARHRARLIQEFLDVGRTDLARRLLTGTVRSMPRRMMHKEFRGSFARSAMRIAKRSVLRQS